MKKFSNAEEIESLKKELAFWQQRAREHAGNAGELRIAIAKKAQKLSNDITIAQNTRLIAPNDGTVDYLDGRIREMQEFWRWLEEMGSSKAEEPGVPAAFKDRIMDRFKRRE